LVKKILLLPPGYKNLSNEDLSPFLRIDKKSKGVFFDVPVMEAVITSRWKQTKNYWMISLLLYTAFLFPIVFSTSVNGINGGLVEHNLNMILDFMIICISHYAAMYLLTIEFMQMKKYKKEYFTIFNIFDLCSITLGVIVSILSEVILHDETNRINCEGIVILMTVTTLILWIEMVC
jgi:hypothetical protein